MPDSISRADVSFRAFIREGRGLARFFNGRSPGVRARRCSSMIVSISRGRGLDQCEFRVPGQLSFSKIPSGCAAASSTSRKCPGVAGWNDSVVAESTRCGPGGSTGDDTEVVRADVKASGAGNRERWQGSQRSNGACVPSESPKFGATGAMLTGIWITRSCPHWEPAGNSAESNHCRRCSCATEVSIK
jgi:hypothetical protein